jgi:amino acid transporter
VLAQSLGSIAPAAASSITPAAMLAVGTGTAAGWSALLAIGVSVLIATAVNVFTRRMAAPGSLYSFAVQGVGPVAGFLTGCALILGYAGIAVTCVAAAAHSLVELLPAGIDPLLAPIALSAAALFVAGVIAFVVVRGTGGLWPWLIAVEVISTAVVVVVAVVLLVDFAALETVPAAPVSTDALGGMPAALVVAVMIGASGFVGFESGTALGPETKRPYLTVPRVVRWTPIVTGLVLLLSTVAQSAAFQATGLDPARTAQPLHDLLGATGSPVWWAPVLDLVVAASFLACGIASVTALARLLFAMGLEGVLPRRLGRVHRRYRTPVIALAASLPVLGGVPVFALLAGADVRSIVDTGVGVGVLGYSLAYLGVSVAAPRFLRRIGEPATGPIVSAWVAAGALLILIPVWALYQAASGRWLSLGTVAVALALAALHLVILNRRYPDRVRSLGLFDATSAKDVLPGDWPAPRRDDGGPAA